MKSNRITTYEHYKSLYTIRDITKSDIINICNQLKQEYLLNHLGIQEFEPESKVEGGILFKSYSGENGPYKSIRFLRNVSWDTAIDSTWEESMEVVIEKYNKIDLFLKAFDFAPKWTQDEKNIFKKVLTNNGFHTSKRGLPIK